MIVYWSADLIISFSCLKPFRGSSLPLKSQPPYQGKYDENLDICSALRRHILTLRGGKQALRGGKQVPGHCWGRTLVSLFLGLYSFHCFCFCHGDKNKNTSFALARLSYKTLGKRQGARKQTHLLRLDRTRELKWLGLFLEVDKRTLAPNSL